MKKILIDTSIWVDYFKGSEVVTGAINDLEPAQSISQAL